MLTPLIGHTSAETAFVQDDYPLGGNYRGKRRVWIETRKGFGQRFCYQTVDPRYLKKHSVERWCTTHNSTYSTVIVLALNSENNHVELQHFSIHDSLEKIEKFAQDWAPALTGAYEQAALKYARALRNAEAKRDARKTENDPQIPAPGEIVRVV